MEKPIRILHLEDRPEDSALMQRLLRRGGLEFTLERVETWPDFVLALREYAPDVVVCDYSLPGMTGLQALATARDAAPEIPVIVFTGAVSEETAVSCLRAGAVDYVLKDAPLRLTAAVEGALEQRREREEKARAVQALQESESRFRSLVESAPDAIIAIDARSRIHLWNSAAEEVFGYSAAEMVGESLHRIIPARLRAAHDFRVAAEAALSTPLRRRLMVSAVRRDGTEFPAEISVSLAHIQGEPSFTAVVRDLSDAVETRKALEALSRQHELLLNSAGEGIVGVGPDGTVSFANPAALALLGLEAMDLLGAELCASICAPERETSSADCPIRAALRAGTTFRGELALRRSDGSAFPAATSLTPILERGVARGGVMIFEDITARREQEEALRASEAKYRSLVDHATYGIYRSTREGRFVSVNPALVEMLGYGSEEALLELDLRRDLYLDPGERERIFRGLGDTDRVVGAETTWVKADGTPLGVRLSGRVARTPGGDFEAFEMMVEDISGRRVLEEQLRQAQKMEAVGQLTGGIAHDFNNVLAVILLNAELISRTVAQGEPVDLDDLRAIQDSARRATTITRKLLGFSRRADLHVEPTDLGRVVSDMRTMLRTTLPETINLVLDVPELNGRAMVDAGTIEQMLLNLVSNSRDALPGGGRVEVTVRETALDADDCALYPGLRPGRHVCLQVSDNGTGMDPEVLRRIFDPFFTTKAKGSGTGLGMAMVYGLTRQQNGHVHVESRLGEGTTTRIFFPVCVGDVAPVRGDSDARGPEAGVGTILVVEDDETLRTVTAKILTSSGYRVLSAADGHEALEVFKARHESINLVLSDLVLPGTGGMDLLRAMQALHGPVRCVLTSGYSADPDSPEGARDRRVPFVRKPWTASELLAVIRRALVDEPPSVTEVETMEGVVVSGDGRAPAGP